MISPKFPSNEKDRQRAVEKYNILDTLPEQIYDSITQIVSSICEAPISLITLLDKERNYLKSHYGVPFNESPRKLSFCGHAINAETNIMVVEDARKDDRFFDNPLVTEANAIFYAGVPLVNNDGYKLGTLCVFDVKPRKLNHKQEEALIALAHQTVYLFEQRIRNQELLRLKEKMEERNSNLEKFASLVSHDLKSPLAQMTSLVQLIEMEEGSMSVATAEYLGYMKNASESLSNYIDGMLLFYKTEEQTYEKKTTVSIEPFIRDLKTLCDVQNSVNWTIATSLSHLIVNKAALQQIMVNLLTNAMKYNTNPDPKITIGIQENLSHYIVSVKDNGKGIAQEHLNKIFDIFYTLQTADISGNQGTGIGLASVKKIIDQLKGTIKVSSIEGMHTTFEFEVPK